MRFAAGVHCISTAHGAMVTTHRGQFAIDRASRSELWDALPFFSGHETRPPSDIGTMQGALLQVGVLEIGKTEVAPPLPPPLPPMAEVTIHGAPTFVGLLVHALDRRRRGDGAPRADHTVIAIEWNMANRDGAESLLRESYRGGMAHWVLAQTAPDVTVMARLVPGRTLCWDCLMRRMGSPAVGDASMQPGSDAFEALADNLWLESTYPDIAATSGIVISTGGKSSPHVALAIPGCPLCADTPVQAIDGGSALHDPFVPDELAILADPEVGVLRELVIYRPVDDALPSFPVCASARIALPTESDGLTIIRGEGNGATKKDAIAGAIGEGIERYAASMWADARMRRAALVEGEDIMFDPRWLVLYDNAQYRREDFPFAPFDPAADIWWTEGAWLDDGAPVWVPATATYLDFPVPARERFVQTTNNGLAAGRGYEDAALRAVYELIECDAFMRLWMTHSSPYRLSGHGSDADVARALGEITRQGAEVELYLLDDHTGHATVLCVGFGDGKRWPGVTVGLGTHATLAVALRKAVFEHSHDGQYMQRLMREGRHAGVATAHDVASSLDHGLFYIDPMRRQFLHNLTTHAATIAFDMASPRFTHPATLAACVACLRGLDIRVAAVDVTPADIALTPYRVVRAVGQYLQPIHFGHGVERRSNPRLVWREEAGIPHPVA